MPQEFQVLQCFSCQTFQVQHVKKVLKWVCKMCGEKQSIKKVYGRGSGSDCRRHVQTLNTLRGQLQADAENAADEYAVGETADCDRLESFTMETLQPSSSGPQGVSRWGQYIEENKADAKHDDRKGYSDPRFTLDRDSLKAGKMARKRKNTVCSSGKSKWQKSCSESHDEQELPSHTEYDNYFPGQKTYKKALARPEYHQHNNNRSFEGNFTGNMYSDGDDENDDFSAQHKRSGWTETHSVISGDNTYTGNSSMQYCHKAAKRDSYCNKVGPDQSVAMGTEQYQTQSGCSAGESVNSEERVRNRSTGLGNNKAHHGPTQPKPQATQSASKWSRFTDVLQSGGDDDSSATSNCIPEEVGGSEEKDAGVFLTMASSNRATNRNLGDRDLNNDGNQYGQYNILGSTCGNLDSLIVGDEQLERVCSNNKASAEGTAKTVFGETYDNEGNKNVSARLSETSKSMSAWHRKVAVQPARAERRGLEEARANSAGESKEVTHGMTAVTGNSSTDTDIKSCSSGVYRKTQASSNISSTGLRSVNAIFTAGELGDDDLDLDL